MARTILIVDDDPVVLKMLEIFLSNSGEYRVLVASSAETGLRLAKEHHPALIISDYYMPEVDGFEFCRRIKGHPELFDTMFILLTAAKETEQKVQGLEIGADDFLTKPVNQDEIRSKVRAMLRIKTLQDELKQEKSELERLNTALHGSVSGVLGLITRVIGLRVPHAGARAHHASRLAGWVSRRLNLDNLLARDIEISAQIHEIGKTVLPDELLGRSPREMSQDDWVKIREFPLYSQRLVEDVPGFSEIAVTLRHQLENYDGTGYPDKLVHDEIPVGSKVLRVVNAIEESGLDVASQTEPLIQRLHDIQGTVLEPRMVCLCEEYLRTQLFPGWMDGKQQVVISNLKPGMVLGMDLYTGGGSKLLPKDTKLTSRQIERIFSIHEYDPIINEIYVTSG